jgi:hypothetical protein
MKANPKTKSCGICDSCRHLCERGYCPVVQGYICRAMVTCFNYEGKEVDDE